MPKTRIFRDLVGDPPPIAALKRFAATDREEDRVTRRRILIADAWRRGHRDKTVLAAAAGISRPTVYEDLRARGIDTNDTDAPILPTRPLPEAALLDQLRLAALSALAALTIDDEDDIKPGVLDDANPHTHSLTAKALVRIFATTFHDRRYVEDTASLGQVRFNIKRHGFDQPTRDNQAQWVAWELRRLGAAADADSFERLIGRARGETICVLVLAPDWDRLVLYREGDDHAWVMPRKLANDGICDLSSISSTALSWDSGQWEPQESGLRQLPAPTTAELDTDPKIRAGAQAAYGPGSDHRHLRLLARWSGANQIDYPDGAAADIDQLQPELRRFFGRIAYMLGADGTVTEVEPYRLDPAQIRNASTSRNDT